MMVRSGNLRTRLRMLALLLPGTAGPGWAQSTAPAPSLGLQEPGSQAPPPQSNRAPDCMQAADKLCQGKGCKDGNSADSAESCSAKVLIPGRQRKPDDCRTDTFVTSALCQS